MAPSNWSMIDNSFPSFTGRERASEQIRALMDYQYMLVEQLKYQLSNLDSTNWNAKALQTMQAETTQKVEKEVSNVAGDVTTTIHNLGEAIDAINALEMAVAQLELDLENLSSGQGTLQEDVEDAQADLDNLFDLITLSTDGNATIGKSGKVLNLVGTVRVNGVTLTAGGNT